MRPELSNQRVFRYDPNNHGTGPFAGLTPSPEFLPSPAPGGYDKNEDYLTNRWDIAFDHTTGVTYTMDSYRVCRTKPF
jgi:hypothetical protein